MRTIQDLENEVLEILDEFDGEYVVTDFELKAQKSLITNIVNIDGTIHYFAGDMENDKHAEEIFPTDEEKVSVLSDFIKYV
jgi:hypothetical protein